MIKMQWIAMCDICGKKELAKTVIWRNEEEHDIPDGWVRSKANHGMHICQECAIKLENDKSVTADV